METLTILKHNSEKRGTGLATRVYYKRGGKLFSRLLCENKSEYQRGIIPVQECSLIGKNVNDYNSICDLNGKLEIEEDDNQ